MLIHQELNLAEHLTLTQNLFLGHELTRGGLLDERTMATRAQHYLELVGLQRAPATKVRQLIVAEKQLVEIAKALSRQARLLIMDEPTATLTPGETARLFALIARLKAQGTTIIYISHKLDEVKQITDEVVVMRDGRFVSRGGDGVLNPPADGQPHGGTRDVGHVPPQAAAAGGHGDRPRGEQALRPRLGD